MEGGGSAKPIYPLGTTHPWHYPPWERGAFPEPRTQRSEVSGAAEATYSAYAACVALSGTPKRGGSANPIYTPWHYPPLGTTPHPNPPPQGGREMIGYSHQGERIGG